MRGQAPAQPRGGLGGATQAPPSSTMTNDLGLGSRLSQRRGARFLNRDGSFNVRRDGLSAFQSLSLYHSLLTIPWTLFMAWVIAGYFAANALFALGYLLCGPAALEGVAGAGFGERFAQAFFFSVQTLATIGYGRVSPVGLPANVLVTIEALVGLLGFALVTGLLFARFSRAEAKIVLSERAVVAPYREITGLMFRIANERENQLIEVRATVTLSRLETTNGVVTRRFYPLSLERGRVVFFPLHWVIVHPIDAGSPLQGMSEGDLAASDAEIMILLSAVDETFSQTVHTRSSYKHWELVWGARFVDMFIKDRDGQPIGIDMGRIHQIEPLP